MLNTLRKYRWFLIPYLFIFLICLIILSIWDKKVVHLVSCEYTSPLFDFILNGVHILVMDCLL